MKKILYLMLSVVLAFAICTVFSGCGSDDSSEAEEQTTATEEYAADTNIYEAIAGEYQDKVSQRAYAVLTADIESDSVEIVVNWAGGADINARWTMHATINEDNQLVYTDCVHEVITYDENGNESVETEYTDGEGYFEYTDGGELAWVGAQDENCRECIFVQTEG